jgi:glucose-1-phosphate thymidylyltransferase
MKGVILSGGHGTRLWPITHTQAKQLIPIANKPLLFYVIEDLVNAGIKDIGIIVGHDPKRIQDIKTTVGDGSRWNAKITYIDQDRPRGIAQAIWLSKEFVGGDSFVVYLGDNLIKGGIDKYVSKFEKSDEDFGILLAKHKTPEKFGVAILEGDKLVGLVEKPAVPPSNWVISGIYMLRPSVFDVIEKQLNGPPGKRGEYQITDVADEMVKTPKYKVSAYMIEDWWKDTGEPKEILEANQLVLDELRPFNNGVVEEGVEVVGKVGIDEGTVVKAGSKLIGPCIIGKNCVIGPGAYIGPHTSVGDCCQIVGGELESSIVLENCTISCDKRIVDSLIGANSKIVSRGNSLPKGIKFVAGENSQIYL